MNMNFYTQETSSYEKFNFETVLCSLFFMKCGTTPQYAEVFFFIASRSFWEFPISYYPSVKMSPAPEMPQMSGDNQRNCFPAILGAGYLPVDGSFQTRSSTIGIALSLLGLLFS